MRSCSATCHPGRPTQIISWADMSVLDLPTPEAEKADNLDFGYILRWFTCPQTDTHPSSNCMTATQPEVKRMTA